MTLTPTHIVAMCATIAVVLGYGCVAARSVKSAEAFSVAGRSAGSGLVAGSIAGTIIGGASTVGTAQLAFTAGLPAWWFTLGSGLGFIVMGVFYARRLRDSSLTTISQFLASRYGQTAGVVASVMASLGIFFSVMGGLITGIGLIASLLAVSPLVAVLILVALVVFYVYFGGMKSAAVGGLLKMLVLYTAMLAAGLFACHALPANLSLAVPSPGWLSLVGQGWGNAVANLGSMLVGVICTQSYIQAIFSASSPRVAAVGTIVGGLITIPVGLPSIAIGLFMHFNAPQTPPLLVLPTYLATCLPPWLGGIALGATMLSIIGSSAGLLLGMGTVISQDIVGKFMRVGDTLLLSRVVCVAVAGLAAAVAVLSLDTPVLFWKYLSMALRGAGIFLPLTLAVFAPSLPLSPSLVTASMVAASLVAMLAPSNALVWALATSAVVLFAAKARG